MARRPRSLEEQLSLAVTKRDKAKSLLEECEKEIQSINQQIEERDGGQRGQTPLPSVFRINNKEQQNVKQKFIPLIYCMIALRII